MSGPNLAALLSKGLQVQKTPVPMPDANEGQQAEEGAKDPAPAKKVPLLIAMSDAPSLKVKITNSKETTDQSKGKHNFFQFENGTLHLFTAKDVELFNETLPNLGSGRQMIRILDTAAAEAQVAEHRAKLAASRGGASRGPLTGATMNKILSSAHQQERDQELRAQNISEEDIKKLGEDLRLTEMAGAPDSNIGKAAPEPVVHEMKATVVVEPLAATGKITA